MSEVAESISERYAWQLDVEGFGASGQRSLQEATVLISRVGGLGGLVAYELAAAGVGHLILAHAGSIKPTDLNRQLLMSTPKLGESRVETARSRLLDLNPEIRVTAVAENLSEANAKSLVDRADLIVDCAPLFEERYAMNDEAVRQGKPMVECGMYGMEAHLTTIIPGKSPCLRCLYPTAPPSWKRRFPVFGGVSGTLGCLAAMEAIKLLSGFGENLTGRLLVADLRRMRFRTIAVHRREGCFCAATRS